MTTKQLNDQIEQTNTLAQISESYADVASNKFKHIRIKVEKNRLYLDELSKVYQAVKQVSSQKNILPPLNGQTISIIITSNFYFYGDINQRLIDFFLKSPFANNSDVIVIGKTGSLYLKEYQYSKNFDQFILKGDFPISEELNQLVERLKNYSQILVFYSKLESAMSQTPTFTDITQNYFLKDAPDLKDKRPFIFEPEIEKVLEFFEGQLKNILLSQTFLESELARTSARMLVMDGAFENANQIKIKLLTLLNIAQKSEINNEILQMYSVIVKMRQE